MSGSADRDVDEVGLAEQLNDEGTQETRCKLIIEAIWLDKKLKTEEKRICLII